MKYFSPFLLQFPVLRLFLFITKLSFVRAMVVIAAVATGLLTITPSDLHAADFEISPLKRCWTAAEYKGVAGEILPRRARFKAGAIKSVTYKTPVAQPTPVALRGSIRRVRLPAGKKLIALTFDLCEASYEIAGYDGRVIDYLRQHNIKATLFVGGKWLESHPLRAQQLIADPLFELGSHGWSHKNLRKVHGRQMQDEINKVQTAYSHAYHALSNRSCLKASPITSLFQTNKLLSKPEQLRLFRFPFGTCNKNSLEAVYKQGQLAIQWDVVTGDPSRGQSAKRIAQVIERRVKPGSIIVAHANGRGHHTAKALPLIIPRLLSKGYQFVTVSELLMAGEPEIASSCYENRPGDNTHY